MRTNRVLALGGIVGPLAFVGAWAALGATRAGYDPLRDPISRLAEDGASTRAAMTTGFLVFGVGVPLFGVALRRGLGGQAGTAAVATGLATIGVAALPLGRGVDLEHGVAATAGYVTLAAVPLLASRRLVGADRAVSTATGLLSAACLAATPFVGAVGLFQRLGLAVVDAWIVVAAVRLARGQDTRTIT
ncbi:MAG TPA: DUF998 domain-containing protein [Acidimicrobiales bacterium]|jgi:hypothetical membrane protein